MNNLCTTRSQLENSKALLTPVHASQRHRTTRKHHPPPNTPVIKRTDISLHLQQLPDRACKKLNVEGEQAHKKRACNTPHDHMPASDYLCHLQQPAPFHAGLQHCTTRPRNACHQTH
jgi:hypothetical protein